MTSTDSFKDAKKKSFHPVGVTGNANISKVRIMKESDGRYMVREIIKVVDILLSQVHFILTYGYCMY